MKYGGMIAEFNPLHDGHRYLLRKMKENGCDRIVVVMSGDFVQRGECAICSKYERTRAALMAGADLVLELPAAAATGSAAIFAESAVSILSYLGCIDELWFGSEAGETTLLEKTAKLLSKEESKNYREVLQGALKNGMTFPAARTEALLKTSFDVFSDAEKEALQALLSSPNNILALEYLIAIRKTNSSLIPRTIRRAGSGYLDTEGNTAFPSALSLRLSEKAGISTGSITQPPLFPDDFSLPLRLKLLTADVSSLAALSDISEDLAKRIVKLANSFTSFSAFAELLKSRNTTYSHISRALTHILLGVTKEDEKKALSPSAVRILGIGKNTDFFAEIKKAGRIRLASSAKEYEAAEGPLSVHASNLYKAVLSDKTGLPFIHEYSEKVIRL